MSRMVSAPSRRSSRITFACVLRLDGSKPSVALAPVLSHRRDEEANILRRHIGQRMRPVFEHALVDALRLAQVRAGIGRDAAIENVMMAALDDVDGVDLHVAEMVHRRRNRLRAGAERLVRIEPLGMQPDVAGPRFWSGGGVQSRGASRGNVAGFARVGSPGFRGRHFAAQTHLTAFAAPPRCRLRFRPRRRRGQPGAHGICRRGR